jgi:CDGSH-type Zn-finger protein
MADTTIKVLDNGPLLVEGGATVCDGDGNAFATDPNKPAIALCRCGASANKPFCDGAHRAAGFSAADRATAD